MASRECGKGFFLKDFLNRKIKDKFVNLDFGNFEFCFKEWKLIEKKFERFSSKLSIENFHDFITNEDQRSFKKFIPVFHQRNPTWSWRIYRLKKLKILKEKSVERGILKEIQVEAFFKINKLRKKIFLIDWKDKSYWDKLSYFKS